MPNWCYSNFVFTGEAKELANFYQDIQEATANKRYLTKNDFGNKWLGNLVTFAGRDFLKENCRGKIDDIYMKSETELVVFTETAWSIATEPFEFILEKYPSIKMNYIAEEENLGYFITNNPKFFDTIRIVIYDIDKEDLDKIKNLVDLEGLTGQSLEYLNSFDDFYFKDLESIKKYFYLKDSSKIHKRIAEINKILIDGEIYLYEAELVK